MIKKDNQVLLNFKKLIKIELNLMIVSWILIIIMLLSFLFSLLPDENGIYIVAIIFWIISSLQIICGIVWLILKIKEFITYSELSESAKSKYYYLFVYLILSIFLALIFVFIIYFSINKINLDEDSEETAFKKPEIKNTIQEMNTVEIEESKNVNNVDYYQELKLLKELLDQNIISEDEFNERKTKILKSMN